MEEQANDAQACCLISEADTDNPGDARQGLSWVEDSKEVDSDGDTAHGFFQASNSTTHHHDLGLRHARYEEFDQLPDLRPPKGLEVN